MEEVTTTDTGSAVRTRGLTTAGTTAAAYGYYSHHDNGNHYGQREHGHYDSHARGHYESHDNGRGHYDEPR